MSKFLTIAQYILAIVAVYSLLWVDWRLGIFLLFIDFVVGAFKRYLESREL